MKSLYDKDYRYTDQALLLESLVYTELSSAMDLYVNNGYSPREISKILGDLVRDLELEAMIGRRSE